MALERLQRRGSGPAAEVVPRLARCGRPPRRCCRRGRGRRRRSRRRGTPARTAARAAPRRPATRRRRRTPAPRRRPRPANATWISRLGPEAGPSAGCAAEPEVRLVRAVADGLAEVHEPGEAEGAEHLVVEGGRRGEVGAVDADVIDHGDTLVPTRVRRVTDDASPYDLAAQAAERLAELTGVERHDVALVLGSGLAARGRDARRDRGRDRHHRPARLQRRRGGRPLRQDPLGPGRRPTGAGLPQPHPLLRGQGRRGGRARRADGGAGRLPHHRAHQRLRRAQGELDARYAGADQRPHQPHRPLADRRAPTSST